MPRWLRRYLAAYHGLPARLWLLCGVGLVNRAGAMVLPFLTLYLVTERGYSTAEVGMIGAAFGLGSIAGSLLGGLAGQRWGVAPVITGSLLAGGLGYLALPLLDRPETFALGVFVATCLNDAFRPAVMAGVALVVEAKDEPRAFAALRLALNLGMSVGPALGGIVASWSYVGLFVGDALSCILAAAVLLWGMRRWGSLPAAPPTRPSPAIAPERPAAPAPRNLRFSALLVVCGVYAVLIFQFFTTVPVFLHTEHGLSEGAVGRLLALQAIIIVALGMPLTRRLQRHPPLRIAALGAAIACAGLGILDLGTAPWVAVASTITWSLGETLSLPFLNAAVAQLARARMSSSMGLYTAAFASGWILAPGVGLWVRDQLGWSALWQGSAAGGLVVAASMLLLAARARPL